MTTMSVSGWMFLLVPAHPGCPGHIPQSRKTVGCSPMLRFVMASCRKYLRKQKCLISKHALVLGRLYDSWKLSWWCSPLDILLLFIFSHCNIMFVNTCKLPYCCWCLLLCLCECEVLLSARLYVCHYVCTCVCLSAYICITQNTHHQTSRNFQKNSDEQTDGTQKSA